MAVCPKCQTAIPAFRWRDFYGSPGSISNPNGSSFLRIYKCGTCGEQLRLVVSTQIIFLVAFVLLGVVSMIMYLPRSFWGSCLYMAALYLPSYYLWWRYVARFRTVAEPSVPSAHKATAFSRAPTTAGSEFSLVVEKVLFVTGKGVVVKGRLEGGPMRQGDAVSIVSRGGISKQSIVLGIDRGRKEAPAAMSGDHIGVLLSALSTEDVQKGDVVRKA